MVDFMADASAIHNTVTRLNVIAAKSVLTSILGAFQLVITARLTGRVAAIIAALLAVTCGMATLPYYADPVQLAYRAVERFILATLLGIAKIHSALLVIIANGVFRCILAVVKQAARVAGALDLVITQRVVRLIETTQVRRT